MNTVSPRVCRISVNLICQPSSTKAFLTLPKPERAESVVGFSTPNDLKDFLRFDYLLIPRLNKKHYGELHEINQENQTIKTLF